MAESVGSFFAPVSPSTPDPSDVVELAAHLVSIQSVNPALDPSGAGEGAIAAYAASWLRRRGLEVSLLDHGDGRSSVVAVARGTGPGGRALLLNAHVDTVDFGGYNGSALEPWRQSGRLYGRGAYDMKGAVAAGMVAAAAAARQGLRGDVVLALVADEEVDSAGTLATLGQDAVKHAAGAIVLEPSQLELVAAHRGFAWYDVEVHGRAAHGSRPDLGVDAILKAGAFLGALGRLGEQWAVGPERPLLGRGSLHAGVIRGGEGISTYPSFCNVSVEARLLPEQSPESVAAEIQALLDDLAAADPGFSATLVSGLHRPAFAADQESDVLHALRAAATKVLRAEPRITGTSFWTDAALLQGAGIPTVMFGPAGGGAHAAQEWVDEASVRSLADILLETAVEFCH